MEKRNSWTEARKVAAPPPLDAKAIDVLRLIGTERAPGVLSPDETPHLRPIHRRGHVDDGLIIDTCIDGDDNPWAAMPLVYAFPRGKPADIVIENGDALIASEPAKWAAEALRGRAARFLLKPESAVAYADALLEVSEGEPGIEAIDRLWEWHSVSRLVGDYGLMAFIEQLHLEGELNAAWSGAIFAAVRETDAIWKPCPVAYDHIARHARASILEFVGEHHMRNYRREKTQQRSERKGERQIAGRTDVNSGRAKQQRPHEAAHRDPEYLAARRAYYGDADEQLRQCRHLAGLRRKPTDRKWEETDDGWGMRTAFVTKRRHESVGDVVDHDLLSRQSDNDEWRRYSLLPELPAGDAEYEPMDHKSLEYASRRFGLTAAERAIVLRLNGKRPTTKLTEIFDVSRYEADSRTLRRMRRRLEPLYARHTRALGENGARPRCPISVPSNP